MNPPSNLFFFDECPGIQILKRLTPDLQTNTTRARLEEFEYIRNGTTDVLAFFNNSNGKVYAECQPNHETTTFLEVFKRHVDQLPPSNEKLHYVMDNLSTHRSYRFCQLVAELSGVICPSEKELNTPAKRSDWLQVDNKQVVIHFTPFHGSWLNLVENWFGIMGRKVLKESYAGADALINSFHAFLAHWNDYLCHPIKWTYDGKGLQEKAVMRFAKMLHTSTEQMDVNILKKLSLLMSNLLRDYFNDVSEQTWSYLFEMVSAKESLLLGVLEKDDRPRCKENTEKAFKDFKAALDEHIAKIKDVVV